MPNEQNIQRIADYIAQNRAAHGLAALRAQLLAAGYSAEDVDAAIARLEQPQAPEPPATPQPPAWQAAEPQQPASPPAGQPPVPGPAAESGEQVIARMVAYLNQNRQQYSLDALRQQLLNQGQRPELVEVALGRVGAAPASRGGVVLPALPWAGGALVLSAIAAGLITAQDSGFDELGWIISLLLGTAIYSGLGLVLLVVGGIVMLANRRGQGMAILFGGLFSLALSAIVAALGFGACLVLISQY
jgi:hypothetical protein